MSEGPSGELITTSVNGSNASPTSSVSSPDASTADSHDLVEAPANAETCEPRLADGRPKAFEMPPVVAELAYDIEMLTVEQAVMRLELSEVPMLMFRNAAHLGLNVVHRREDGSIGWIDPRGVRQLNS